MVRRDSRIILASHFIENMADEGDEEYSQRREMIARAVDSLPEELRLVVEAIIYERLTYREAADRLGYKAHSQVYYKLDQATDMLREKLEEWI